MTPTASLGAICPLTLSGLLPNTPTVASWNSCSGQPESVLHLCFHLPQYINVPNPAGADKDLSECVLGEYTNEWLKGPYTHSSS